MKVDNLERFIISGLLTNKPFSNVVVSFTKPEYFENAVHKRMVEVILEYIAKYHQLPNRQSLEIELDKDKTLSEDDYKESTEVVKEVFNIEHDENQLEWALNTSEEYFRKRAMFNAIMDGIQILDGKDKKRTEDALPAIMQEALNVSFDMSVGHEYFEDAESRWKSEEVEKIPFKHEILNIITNGGIPKNEGSLIVLVGGSGGGKSMFMSDHGAYQLAANGLNVLYFTMELSEKQVGQRIDANLFQHPINHIEEYGTPAILDQISAIKKKTHGRLFIKEFPSGSASVTDFRRVIKELQMKKGFKPDIVYVDYIGICASARLKLSDSNSYGLGNAISVELRGLAQELKIPLMTAAQLNRSGYGNDAKKIGADNIADSIAIIYNADMALSLFSNEELKEQNKVIVGQLKNRFGDAEKFKRFALGQDTGRMTFFDIKDDEQNEMLMEKFKGAEDYGMQATQGGKLMQSSQSFETFDFG